VDRSSSSVPVGVSKGGSNVSSLPIWRQEPLTDSKVMSQCGRVFLFSLVKTPSDLLSKVAHRVRPAFPS
jgi:hypothetical protein